MPITSDYMTLTRDVCLFVVKHVEILVGMSRGGRNQYRLGTVRQYYRMSVCAVINAHSNEVAISFVVCMSRAYRYPIAMPAMLECSM
jgi:hypothetical protein